MLTKLTKALAFVIFAGLFVELSNSEFAEWKCKESEGKSKNV